MAVRTLENGTQTRLLGDVINKTRDEDSDHQRIEEQNKIRVDVGDTMFTRAEDVPLSSEHWANYERTIKEDGITISQLFERLNPTDSTKREQGYMTDAFTRQMKRFGIRTKSDPLNGIPASTVADFLYPPERDSRGHLVDEKVRAATAGVFQSNDPQSWILFPEFINRQLRVTGLPQDILGEIVAKVQPVDSQGYRSIYLEDVRDQRRMTRIPERGQFPTIYIQTKEHETFIEKYGIRIEGTYEYARRVRLDILSIFLQRIAAQNKLDQAEQGVDILINGDGNANAAPNWNLSTLDANVGTGPGTVYDTFLALYGYPNQSSTISKALSYNAFLKFKATIFPYQMTTMLGRLNELLQIITLQFPNINPLLLLSQFGAEGVKIGTIELAQDMWGSVRLVYMPFMVGGLILGLDKNMALEELVEVNSNITENARNILTQTNHLVVSINMGFSVIIGEARLTLTLS